MVFSGALSKQEIEGLEEVVSPSEVWRKKAMDCAEIRNGARYHNWIPISWSISEKSKHVNTIMCTLCFHELNISEAFEHRVKF